ncbi:hypothetical protein LAY57_36020 [Argonema antarcticum A004/B2]|nr:hypothetical protein [Argonema antarcticum A004/B2]
MQIDAQGEAQSNTTYRYDAFGRRVSKTHQKTGEQSQTTHYGWDGDRLVHTKRDRPIRSKRCSIWATAKLATALKMSCRTTSEKCCTEP